MQKTLAILAGKAAGKFNRLTGSGGTALPGLVAKKFSGTILADLAKQNFPRGSIVVTGTNGKTTTTRLIASAFEAAGLSYLHNRAGSNLERGIVASLVEKATLSGEIKAQIGLFEVDEAYIPTICEQIKPSYVIVTNLFRDQLDRYGELDSIAASFKTAFAKLKNTHFIFNADDPLVASLGLEIEDKTKVHYFGIDSYEGPKLQHDHSADSMFSPVSQVPLLYSQRYFAHIGIYRSSNKDFDRPEPEFAATKVVFDGNGFTEMNVKDTTGRVTIGLTGLYNVYNALAAITCCQQVGIAEKTVLESLQTSTTAFGRAEQIEFKHKKLLLLLIKNPTGFNQIIQTYLIGKKSNPLWIIINDKIADGRDVSWLWDAAIEDIGHYEGSVMVSGTRAVDMALRLKYAGLTDVTIEADIPKALDKLTAAVGKRTQVFVLPTYTAMRELRALLVKNTDIAQEYDQ